MRHAVSSESVPFTEVEKIRCPKCAAGPDCKCWIMSGRGVTSKTQIVPHVERAIAFFRLRDDTEPSPAGQADGGNK